MAKKEKREDEPIEPEVNHDEEEEQEGRRLKPLILGGAIAIAVGAMVVATTFFLLPGDGGEGSEGVQDSAEVDPHSGDEGHDSAPGHETQAGDPHGGGGEALRFFPLESFIVNIADRKRDRYLKMRAELELSNDEVRGEIGDRIPQIKDVIISLLGSKTFEDVRTIEGKNLLREEIMTRVNALLRLGKVKRVFFTEFVVQ